VREFRKGRERNTGSIEILKENFPKVEIQMQ
jgi:hypothetical protein